MDGPLEKMLFQLDDTGFGRFLLSGNTGGKPGCVIFRNDL